MKKIIATISIVLLFAVVVGVFSSCSIINSSVPSSGDIDPEIVGKWKSKSNEMTLLSDGTGSAPDGPLVDSIRYTAKNGRIEITYTALGVISEAMIGEYTINGNELTIDWKDGKGLEVFTKVN